MIPDSEIIEFERMGNTPAGFRVEKDARVMQLLFYHLNTEVAERYSGRYQNENL